MVTNVEETSDLRFRARLVDLARQSFIVTDVAGTITYWNRYATVMYGWTPEEALGQSITLIVTEAGLACAAEIMDDLRAGRLWQGEFAVRRKDGSTFMAHVLDVPMLDEAGELVGIIGISDDTSNLRRLEGAARYARTQLQRSFELARMGAWTWSLSSDELRWGNDELSLPGLTRERLPKSIAECVARVSGRQRELMQDFVERVRAGAPDLEMQLDIDGAFLHVRAVRHLDADGNPEVVGIVQDVSAQVRAEQSNHALRLQLEQAQKLESLGRLAGGVAHDINNLLTGISLFTSLLHTQSPMPRTVLDKLEAILELCKRGSALTNNLLGFARRGKYQPEAVDASWLVQDTSELLRHTVSKQIVIHTEIEPGLAPWWGDRAQLHQLVMNLCLNAIDALGNRGTLSLQLAAELVESETDARGLSPGNYVRLDVIDDGCGMDEQTLARAFEPFFTTKPKGTGTGLGLSMAHGTALSHSGALVLRSEEGRGTTVSLWIPAVTRVAEQSAAAAKPKPMRTSPRARILVVDDEYGIRMGLSELLEQMGHEVTTACDGEDALLRVQEQPEAFTLVLLDLVMPVLDGISTFHALRRDTPRLPIVLMSGHGDQEVVARLLESGTTSFLHKPFTPHMLAATLDRALAQLERRE